MNKIITGHKSKTSDISNLKPNHVPAAGTDLWLSVSHILFCATEYIYSPCNNNNHKQNRTWLVEH